MVFPVSAVVLIALTGVLSHSSIVATLVPLNTVAMLALRFSSLTSKIEVTGLTSAQATLTGRLFDLHSSSSQVPS